MLNLVKLPNTSYYYLYYYNTIRYQYRRTPLYCNNEVGNVTYSIYYYCSFSKYPKPLPLDLSNVI